MMGEVVQATRAAIPDLIVENLPNPVLTISDDDRLCYVNAAAEEFFQRGRRALIRQRIQELLPPSSPALSAVAAARSTASPVNEYGVLLGMARAGTERLVDLHVAPLGGDNGLLLITLAERSIPDALDRQTRPGHVARSVSAMAAYLAHEIRNPLAGIRGAAQLIEPQLNDDNRALADLICNETDRIRALVGQMECFTDERPPVLAAVNIHVVLERVRRLISAEYGDRIRIREQYDPSLPATPGNADQLIQVFFNLLKNAAESIATGKGVGEISLRTAFNAGLRMALGGSAGRRPLPLLVEVADNGPGIPVHVRPEIFHAFYTTKANGRGLGLALAAKIVSDHGGTIDCPSVEKGALFRVMLPTCPAEVGQEPSP